MLEKQCKACGKWLPADKSNFYLSKKRRDGLETKCIPCYRVGRGWPILHKPTIAQRFWSRVKLPDMIGTNECWEWMGSRSANGYGRFNPKHGAKCLAHRFMYELVIGPIPDGMFVCHSCDNPPCCNPSHLFAGTPQDNMDDMENKGRRVSPDMSGSKNPRARVSEGMVIEMRRLYKSGTRIKELCNMFNLSFSATSHIVNRYTWKHIPERDENSAARQEASL